MTDPLLPDQKIGARWLADRKFAYLADEMRVGKTPTAIRAADLIGARRILWLTTGAARRSHAKAWDRFSPLSHDVVILDSGSGEPLDVGVSITSYNLAAGALFNKLRAKPWDLIVLDEAHRLKTPTTARSKAVFGADFRGKEPLEQRQPKGALIDIEKRVEPGLIYEAGACFALSGTPAPNHPGELWTVIRAMFPQAIMREKPASPMPYSFFEYKYCKTKPNPFGRPKIVGGKNLKELRERIAPYFLRRKFADLYPDAAGVDAQVFYVDASTRLEALKELERDELIQEVAHRLARAKTDDDRADIMGQVDASVQMRIRRLTGLAKAPAVAEWVAEQLADDPLRKFVLFGHHKDVLDALCDKLQKYNPVRVSGGVSPKRKAEAEETFTNDAKRRVFVGNLQAAGEAIDLSVADDVVFVESSWVPGENDQAAKRIVNLAKTKENVAWFATLSGSIDEQIQETNARKTNDLLKLFG